jgi:hypothetical protein
MLHREHAVGEQDQMQKDVDAEREAKPGQPPTERRSVSVGREPVGKQGEGASSPEDAGVRERLYPCDT